MTINLRKVRPASFGPLALHRTAATEADVEHRIVEAARAILAESGYAGTHVRAVADRAGLGIEAVSRYFSSKRHLYFAVLDSTEALVCDRLRAVIESQATFVDSVNDLLDEVARLRRDAPAATQFLAGVSADLSQNPELRAAREIHCPQQHAVVEELVRRGVTSGELSTVDTQVAVDTVTAIMVGLWQISSLASETPTSVIEGFKRLITAQLLRRPLPTAAIAGPD